jgi:hypothetical protein
MKYSKSQERLLARLRRDYPDLTIEGPTPQGLIVTGQRGANVTRFCLGKGGKRTILALLFNQPLKEAAKETTHD